MYIYIYISFIPPGIQPVTFPLYIVPHTKQYIPDTYFITSPVPIPPPTIKTFTLFVGASSDPHAMSLVHSSSNPHITSLVNSSLHFQVSSIFNSSHPQVPFQFLLTSSSLIPLQFFLTSSSHVSYQLFLTFHAMFPCPSFLRVNAAAIV